MEFKSSSFEMLDIINLQDLKPIKVSEPEKIEEIIQEKFGKEFKIYAGRFSFNFDEWVDENKVKIKVHFSSNSNYYEGWYIYDLENNKVIEEEIEEFDF